MKRAFFVLFLLEIVAVVGCSVGSTSVDVDEYKANGTIHKSVNTFTIKSDDGRVFVPESLSNEFKIDKLRVTFSGYIQKDNTLPQNVESIKLTSIKKI